ncbi:MAG TPA: hypothetical protein VFL94_16500 [Actinomycetales bacterium]|nr:hypothetical protein [Actinomycetales bacterium]
MLSTSLPSALFVEDGAAVAMVRPRAVRAGKGAVAEQGSTQTTQRLAETPRWLTLVRQSWVSAS